VSAAILVGGRGNRLGGHDKARLLISTSPRLTTLERLVSLMSPHVRDVFLVGRAGQSFPEVPCRFVADRRDGLGPLAALETSLLAAGTPWCFLLACDMPAVDTKILDTLAAARAVDLDAVVFAGPAGLEPTCALYRTALAATVTAALDAGERALHTFVTRQRCQRLNVPAALAPQLSNINTAEDLEAWSCG
jgi:molybdopterin-guanine dinucleotide biosynthesis protein A